MADRVPDAHELHGTAGAGPRSGAGHLPKQGGDTSAGPPRHLPRQRRGTTPQMLGRYPDYDVLATTEHWDPVTRRVVLERVGNVPAIRFFDAAEEAALRAFCDVVLAQDSEPRVPVLEMVDAKMYEQKLDGFHYADMPKDPETWRRVARESRRERPARGLRGRLRGRRGRASARDRPALRARANWTGTSPCRGPGRW